MVSISSHVLDSVSGTHASAIRVQCFQCLLSGERRELFDVIASTEGRISEAIKLDEQDRHREVELLFHASDYYSDKTLPDDGFQLMPVLVVRLNLPESSITCHVPVMLSPHSCSIWWSGAGR